MAARREPQASCQGAAPPRRSKGASGVAQLPEREREASFVESDRQAVAQSPVLNRFQPLQHKLIIKQKKFIQSSCV